MGGDGGVIATQRKFCRHAKDADALDQKVSVRNNQVLRTQLCVQSQETLREPIACCEMGNLYNKEAVLDALLNKTLNPTLVHIRGLKDTKTLKFCLNPNYDESKETDGQCLPKFMCPITKLDFNGQSPFVCIWSTGYVLSRKAIRQMGIETLQAEYGPFTDLDVVSLNPLTEEVDDMIALMKQRRSKGKEIKKSSKRKSSNGKLAGDNSADLETKKKREEEKGQAALSSSFFSNYSKSSGKANLGLAVSLARDATKTIQEQSAKSDLYKNLFHKDKEKDHSARDLLMSVAGLRYTNGMQK